MNILVALFATEDGVENTIPIQPPISGKEADNLHAMVAEPSDEFLIHHHPP